MALKGIHGVLIMDLLLMEFIRINNRSMPGPINQAKALEEFAIRIFQVQTENQTERSTMTMIVPGSVIMS